MEGPNVSKAFKAKYFFQNGNGTLNHGEIDFASIGNRVKLMAYRFCCFSSASDVRVFPLGTNLVSVASSSCSSIELCSDLKEEEILLPVTFTKISRNLNVSFEYSYNLQASDARSFHR